MADTLTRREALAALLAAPAGAATRHRDIIRLEIEHQTIDHFAASDCWSMQKIGAWKEENRERVASLLFSPDTGIALSCWRFNLGGGINNAIHNPWRTAETFEVAEGRYDWKRQANERWFLRAARRHGVEHFIAFVNSPPGRMTKNGLTNGLGSSGTTNLKPGFEGQYARYLGDILRHFRDNPSEDERIDFDFVSPVNEPQWDWDKPNQEGNHAANEDIRRIAGALGEELRRQRLNTRVLLVESGSIPDMYGPNAKATAKYGALYGNYLDELLRDATISGYLDHRIGYHSYWSDRLDGQLIPHRERLKEKMREFPEWRVWQTEYCVMTGPEGKGGRGRDLTMRTALDIARVIHYDLTLAGVSSWSWWTAVSPEDYKDGLIYTDYRKPGDTETIYPAKSLWTMGNYSRFVRPGMKRVELEGEGHGPLGLLASAYKDEAARRLAAVYLNCEEQAAEVNLTVRRGADETKLRDLKLYLTSDASGDDLRRLPSQPSGGLLRIPPKSALTLTAAF